MSQKTELILVTGITGFVAGHVADQLLEAGYLVRGTTRGGKAKILSETIKRPGLEFVRVDDIIDSDLTEALKGVSAIIHVASPIPGNASVQHTLDSAKEGTLHILREALKAGIEKVVVTSTFGNLMNPDLSLTFSDRTFTSKDWGHVTVEEALDPEKNDVFVYFASKLLAERALWQFVKEHPQLDVVAILPGMIFGPYPETYPRPITKDTLGTNKLMYATLKGHSYQFAPYIVDVRDVAKGHVLALNLPRNPGAIERRYIVNSGNATLREAVDHLRVSHPELKLPPTDQYTEAPGSGSILDTSNTITDLKFGKFREPTQVVDDTVDALLEVEKTWA